jgi:hypothetical protein
MSGRDLAEPTWDLLSQDEQARLTRWVQRRVEGRMRAALLETGTFTVHADELHTWSTDPEGLYDDAPGAVGYVSHVDRDTGTVQVSSGAPLRDPPGISADDPSGPWLLYHLAVVIGAQPPIAECWPR